MAKKFKQKNYTIQEGSYTGPKDLENGIPGALKLIGGGIGVGSLGGFIAGRHSKTEHLPETMWKGAKIGGLSGLFLKIFLNYIHKPMNHVKYQEVDRAIRQQFGVYRISGFTIGDSLGKRSSMSEKISFNSRNVDDFKVNIAIHNDKVTLYTFAMSNEELDKTSELLDYYCQKFFAMEYTSKLINQRVNSYSIDITFTNYQVISQFILELQETLNTRINILNIDAIVKPRLEQAAEQREFSRLSEFLLGALNCGWAEEGVDALLDFFNDLENWKLEKLGVKCKNLDNDFLFKVLDSLYYRNGFHYTVNDKKAKITAFVSKGLFVICTKDKESEDKLDQLLHHIGLNFEKRKNKNASVYLCAIDLNKKKAFENMLRKLISLDKLNIQDRLINRVKLFSAMENQVILKLKEKLEKEKEIDWEVSDYIPNDSISVTANLSSIKIYVPEEFEYSQYDIDDFIRTEFKYIRTNVSYDRNILVMKLNGALTQVQFEKLVKYIIKSQGYCTLLTTK